MKSILIAIAILTALLLAVIVFKDGEKYEHDVNEHRAYAAQCTAQIGPLPDFSCSDGALVPVTVNGETPEAYTPNMNCDRPALLNNGAHSDGQCVPYSRILDLSTDSMQAVAMCRQKRIRAADSLQYDELDVISHNPATGATCWFSADAKNPDEPLNGQQVPSPTAVYDVTFWNSPSVVAKDGCGNCHDNDPFMYSPFVGQVWQHVPVNPLGAYFHVAPEMGFSTWPTTAMNLRDNTCLGCHRIGVNKTCSSLTEWLTGIKKPEGADQQALHFPLSHGMPPNHDLSKRAWNTIYAESVEQIRSCCENNSQSMCRLSPIPAHPQGPITSKAATTVRP